MADNRNNMHWRSGYAAYDSGLRETANNNEPGTEAFDMWDEGWHMAEEDDKIFCPNCGEEMFFDGDWCDDCEEEEARF